MPQLTDHGSSMPIIPLTLLPSLGHPMRHTTKPLTPDKSASYRGEAHKLFAVPHVLRCVIGGIVRGDSLEITVGRATRLCSEVQGTYRVC